MSKLPESIRFDNVKFRYATNFSGNPDNDPKFHSSARRATLVLPDEQIARELIDMGVNVRTTHPRPDDDPNEFVPEYLTSVTLKYRNWRGEELRRKPKVVLVNEEKKTMTELNEDTVGMLDGIRIKSVDLVVNPWENTQRPGSVSLCIQTMYVVQGLSDDPYYTKYSTYSSYGESDPF